MQFYVNTVLSASGGIKVNHPKMSNDVVVLVAVVILIGLFSLQHCGTDKVGWLFAPIVLLWFLLIGAIGALNIWKYDSSVLKAFYPIYIYRYFRRRKRDIVIVMVVTTFLMIPIMLLVWRSHWILVSIFTTLSLSVELPYLSAVLFKVDQGGWVPLVIAAAFLVVMYVWHYCTVKRYELEVHSRVSMAWMLGLGPSLGLVRVPGIGFVYTELASGVPHIFSHFITNLPAIHSVVVFICIKYLPVYTVPLEERFLVKRIGPKSFHMFRCVTRYGYKDLHKKDDDFEKMLFDSLSLFVRLERMMEGHSDSEEYYSPQATQATDKSIALTASQNGNCHHGIVPARSPCRENTTSTVGSSGQTSKTTSDELEFLNRCKEAGVVHILGNTIVRARRNSGVVNKIAVDYIYAFLRRVCRENSVIFNVPHESLLNVGQMFYI
ncbi:hypothetical protein B296_00008908 [Ensete ventricosum]|uniref:Potassium transporter n=1 Tax=Ensete ventricosum TaxID=4639 RepID=A0A426ZP70_ENSVE|nr:hypothetical protein B296_00008908 [Ensete ventricosum]